MQISCGVLDGTSDGSLDRSNLPETLGKFRTLQECISCVEPFMCLTYNTGSEEIVKKQYLIPFRHLMFH